MQIGATLVMENNECGKNYDLIMQTALSYTHLSFSVTPAVINARENEAVVPLCGVCY